MKPCRSCKHNPPKGTYFFVSGTTRASVRYDKARNLYLATIHFPGKGKGKASELVRKEALCGTAVPRLGDDFTRALAASRVFFARAKDLFQAPIATSSEGATSERAKRKARARKAQAAKPAKVATKAAKPEKPASLPPPSRDPLDTKADLLTEAFVKSGRWTGSFRHEPGTYFQISGEVQSTVPDMPMTISWDGKRGNARIPGRKTPVSRGSLVALRTATPEEALSFADDLLSKTYAKEATSKEHLAKVYRDVVLELEADKVLFVEGGKTLFRRDFNAERGKGPPRSRDASAQKLISIMANLPEEIELGDGRTIRRDGPWTRAYRSRPGIDYAIRSPGGSYTIFFLKEFQAGDLELYEALGIYGPDQNQPGDVLERLVHNWKSIDLRRSSLEKTAVIMDLWVRRIRGAGWVYKRTPKLVEPAPAPAPEPEPEPAPEPEPEPAPEPAAPPMAKAKDVLDSMMLYGFKREAAFAFLGHLYTSGLLPGSAMIAALPKGTVAHSHLLVGDAQDVLNVLHRHGWIQAGEWAPSFEQRTGFQYGRTTPAKAHEKRKKQGATEAQLQSEFPDQYQWFIPSDRRERVRHILEGEPSQAPAPAPAPSERFENAQRGKPKKMSQVWAEAKSPHFGETYARAKARFLNALREDGWKVQANLKVPHATSADGKTRLWFKPQAIWVSYGSSHDMGHARSAWLGDYRGKPSEDFLAWANRLAKAQGKP